MSLFQIRRVIFSSFVFMATSAEPQVEPVKDADGEEQSASDQEAPHRFREASEYVCEPSAH